MLKQFLEFNIIVFLYCFDNKININTVEALNNGQVGARAFVHYLEVGPFNTGRFHHNYYVNLTVYLSFEVARQ